MMPRQFEFEELESRRLLAVSPTPDEQEFLQLVNRFRTDPRGEYTRLISSTSPLKSRDPILQDDLDFASVNGSTLRSELLALTPTHPVAWNEAILQFNRNHNQAMIQRGVHFHSNTLDRREALLASGVNLRFAAGEKINSEIVFGYGKSVNHIFASYVIDWGRGGPGGMLSGRPHRVALINPDFEEAGNAITNHNGTANPPLGPKVNSAVLANIEGSPVYVTGAVFQDRNGSKWYEAGEGISSVRLRFIAQDGTEYSTVAYSTGGYQIALPPGTYNAIATSGNFAFPLQMRNIVVGNSSVWKNWIYDPEVVPPDIYESNSQRASATNLSGQDETVQYLSLHKNDVDWFRFDAPGTGPGKVDLKFKHAAGDIDFEVLQGNQRVASSTTTTNNESASLNLQGGLTYHIRVYGKNGAQNGEYTLVVDTAPALPPVAMADRATIESSAGSLTVNILANDSNPDGTPSELTPILQDGTSTAFQINSAKQLVYSPISATAGVHRARYFLENADGLTSAAATISVFVIDYSDATPWQNNSNGFDVNDDGVVAPIDVLLVVNEINQWTSNSALPNSGTAGRSIFGFVDSSGDGYLTPIDVLLVVNAANANGEGENALGLEGIPPSIDPTFSFLGNGREEEEKRMLIWDEAMEDLF